MSDAFVPEADRLDQEKEVDPSEYAEREGSRPAATGFPTRVPFEASEGDVLEQAQVVEETDDRW